MSATEGNNDCDEGCRVETKDIYKQLRVSNCMLKQKINTMTSEQVSNYKLKQKINTITSEQVQIETKDQYNH